MGITFRTQYFHTAHAVTEITVLHDTGCLQFPVKTGPTATRMKFAGGIKQHVSTANTLIGDLHFMMNVNISLKQELDEHWKFSLAAESTFVTV